MNFHFKWFLLKATTIYSVLFVAILQHEHISRGMNIHYNNNYWATYMSNRVDVQNSKGILINEYMFQYIYIIIFDYM